MGDSFRNGNGPPRANTRRATQNQNTMITTEQKQAADNAAQSKHVVLRYAGVQPGFQHIQPTPLFNVVEGDYCVGSTITLKTAFRLGLRVEVVE